MKKQKVLIAVDSLIIGGIQKSLLAFLDYIHYFCDIDVLVWYDKREEFIRLPDYVNRIHVFGTESIKSAKKYYGFFSADFLVSLFSSLRKKRWLSIPKIKKQYDIAIAYSHVSNLKFYLIDKVDAKRKYAFYHHGAYVFGEETMAFDREYYVRYNKIFAVSTSAEKVLRNTFPELKNIYIIPNLINVKSILESSKESCIEYSNCQILKLLTVGRLSQEKNPLRIIETAKRLREKQMDFRWVVVGDGDLYNTMKRGIHENQLDDNVVLVGRQMNPYRFMSRCDYYLQFSLYEADPITIREVAVFNKPMILSDNPSFRECCNTISNIRITDDISEIEKILIQRELKQTPENNPDTLNAEIYRIIDREIFENLYERCTVG